MHPVRRILLTAVFGAAAASFASANTIGYTAFFPPTGSTDTDFSYTLTLPKFDPSLGTLQSVTLYFFVQEQTTQLNFTNNSGSAENFSISVESVVNQNGLTNSAMAGCVACTEAFPAETITTVSTGNVTLGTSGNCAFATPTASCGSVDYANAGNVITKNNLTGVTGTGVQGVTGVKSTVGQVDEHNYIGPGTFTLSSNTQSLLVSGSGGGNVKLTLATVGKVAAEVDYVYAAGTTSIPEPAPMALVGSGLAAMGLFRKRATKR
jgi:hypothetical protein